MRGRARRRARGRARWRARRRARWRARARAMAMARAKARVSHLAVEGGDGPARQRLVLDVLGVDLGSGVCVRGRLDGGRMG